MPADEPHRAAKVEWIAGAAEQSEGADNVYKALAEKTNAAVMPAVLANLAASAPIVNFLETAPGNHFFRKEKKTDKPPNPAGYFHYHSGLPHQFVYVDPYFYDRVFEGARVPSIMVAHELRLIAP